MRVLVASAVVVALASGCGKPPAEDTLFIESIEPATMESVGPGTTVTREIDATTFLTWSGPQATEVISRVEPMTVDAGGNVKSGGMFWSRFDSIGAWFTRSAMVIVGGLIGITGLGVLASVLGSGGVLSRVASGIAQVVTFPIPLLGAIVQAARASVASTRFTEVVDGGEQFKTSLQSDPTLTDTQRASLWEKFKTSQKAAQSSGTRTAVQRLRGKV